MSDRSGSPAGGENLSEFERFSVLRGAAALALWPPNSDRHVALRVLVDSCADASDNGTGSAPPIDAAGWRRWLAGPGAAAVRATQPDGTHDAPIAADTALLGRHRALIAGDLEFPDLHYRLRMEALYTLLSEAQDPQLLAALQTLEVVSVLCGQVVTRAGLGWYKWPDHELDHELAVPEDAVYERLCRALTFSADQIEKGLGLDDFDFDPLLRRDGEPAIWRPLTRAPDGSLLVVDPWRLAMAGLVQAGTHAASSARLPELLERLEAGALAVAVEAAEDMDWQIEQVDGRSVLARADVDCLVLVSVYALEPPVDAGSVAAGEAPTALAHQLESLGRRAAELGASHAVLTVLSDGREMTVPAGHPYLHRQEQWDPWVLDVAELRLLGDALRRDPLALPAALERVPPPPWPGGLDLVDWIGVRKQLEWLPRRPDEAQDGTELLWKLARFMSDRHPAPWRDGSGWGEVTRWGGVADSAIFRTPGEKRFALLARATGRSIWVSCADPAVGKDDLAGIVCRILSHWLARLGEREWPLIPEEWRARELLIWIEVEIDERPGPALSVAAVGDRRRLCMTPGFVHVLSRGDNEADRMLVAAVLAEIGDRAPEAQLELLDELLPAGRGTVMIWADPSKRSIEARLPPPEVTVRERTEVEEHLVALAMPPGQIAVFSDDELGPALGKLVEGLETMIDGRVAALDPSCLVELIALHEQALAQSGQRAVMLPAHEALEDFKELLGSDNPSGDRNIALRGLVERVSAAPPNGERPLGLREGSRLRAAAELGVQLGAAHAAVGVSEVKGRVVLGSMIGVSLELEGALPSAGARMVEQMAQAAPDQMAIEHEDWWTDRPRAQQALDTSAPIVFDEPGWKHVDEAMAQEWGVGLEQILRLLRVLCDRANVAENAVTTATRKELAAALGEATAIDPPAVEAALDLLTLGPCADYDVLAAAHRPWGVNRSRSYLRRPLVQLPDGRLAWSAQHTLGAGRYLAGLIQGGRLRAGGELRRAVAHFSQGRDFEFERELLERVRELGWEAKLQVEELGGLRLQRGRGEPIGDIDVLAWSPAQRRVWLLDAKRWAQGLVPHAMEREGGSLLDSVEHHSERLAWVEAHREQLAAELGIDAAGWTVGAAVVLDRPLAGAHLSELALPVWTFWELPQKLAA